MSRGLFPFFSSVSWQSDFLFYQVIYNYIMMKWKYKRNLCFSFYNTNSYYYNTSVEGDHKYSIYWVREICTYIYFSSFHAICELLNFFDAVNIIAKIIWFRIRNIAMHILNLKLIRWHWCSFIAKNNGNAINNVINIKLRQEYNYVSVPNPTKMMALLKELTNILIISVRQLVMPSECESPTQRALADAIIRMLPLDEIRILLACGAKVSTYNENFKWNVWNYVIYFFLWIHRWMNLLPKVSVHCIMQCGKSM